MTLHTIEVPSFGDVQQVSVVEWLAAVGDTLTAGTPLVLLETDKVDTELPAPFGGTLVEVLVGEGVEVTTGTPLCVIEVTDT